MPHRQRDPSLFHSSFSAPRRSMTVWRLNLNRPSAPYLQLPQPVPLQRPWKRHGLQLSSDWLNLLFPKERQNGFDFFADLSRDILIYQPGIPRQESLDGVVE